MENIQKVKKKIMEWLEEVEEARSNVEETLKNRENTEEAGIEMDAENEQEVDDCEKGLTKILNTSI